MSTVRRLPATIAVCIALVAITGCSDDGERAADGTATTTATTISPPATVGGTVASTTGPDVSVAPTTPASTSVPDAVIDIDNQPGEGEYEGALDDLAFECVGSDGTWSASGTVTNSTDAPAGYRVFISFLDDAGETAALVEADDDLDGLEPGESREWAVSFDSSSASLTCVPRVERRPA